MLEIIMSGYATVKTLRYELTAIPCSVEQTTTVYNTGLLKMVHPISNYYNTIYFYLLGLL